MARPTKGQPLCRDDCLQRRALLSGVYPRLHFIFVDPAIHFESLCDPTADSHLYLCSGGDDDDDDDDEEAIADDQPYRKRYRDDVKSADDTPWVAASPSLDDALNIDTALSFMSLDRHTNPGHARLKPYLLW